MSSGAIIAGPHVRAACARHLADLETAADRGLVWDLAAAQRAIRFFPDVLTVLRDGRIVPFELEPWQAFLVGSLFGWKVEATGWRRFSTAYVETGKGSGKSPLAAGIGHYMLLADKEARAEVYAAATKKDQAMILFNDAVAMRASSPHLSQRLIPSGVNPVYKLTHYKSGSFFKPISNDDGQSGPRPSCALVDEVHEHKDRTTIVMLEAGFKFRNQPLLFLITNSGSDKKTVAGEYHDHAVAVVKGERQDDSFFAYVCALDEGDDPFEDESCWPKANPSLGRTIKVDYLRRQVANAKSIPGNENTVRRLNFCEWTDADAAWMSRAAWRKCEVKDVRIEDFEGAVGYGGLDMSYRFDLTALASVFPETVAGVEHLYAFVDFWTPADTLRKREEEDRVPYLKWAESGFLRPVPGKVIRLAALAHRMAYFAREFDWQGTAYDEYREKDLVDELDELDFSDVAELMIPHPQGFRRAKLYDARGRPIKDLDTGKQADNPLWMPTSVEALQSAIIEERLHVLENPVLRWNVGAVAVREDPAGTGGKIFSKLRATGRIDGAVALAEAVGLANSRPVKKRSLAGFLSNPVVAK